MSAGSAPCRRCGGLDKLDRRHSRPDPRCGGLDELDQRWTRLCLRCGAPGQPGHRSSSLSRRPQGPALSRPVLRWSRQGRPAVDQSLPSLKPAVSAGIRPPRKWRNPAPDVLTSGAGWTLGGRRGPIRWCPRRCTSRTCCPRGARPHHRRRRSRRGAARRRGRRSPTCAARGEPQGRLVDEHQLRLCDVGRGQGQHLLLATRQRARPLGEALPEPREDRGRELDALLGVGRARLHQQVLAHREVPVDASALGDVAHPGLRPLGRGSVRDVPTADQDLPRARLHQPRRDSQGRRLAGSVGADQGGHRARRHRQRDVAKHRRGAVARVDVAQFEGRGVRCRRAAPTGRFGSNQLLGHRTASSISSIRSALDSLSEPR
jgi:hypothetical protein